MAKREISYSCAESRTAVTYTIPTSGGGSFQVGAALYNRFGSEQSFREHDSRRDNVAGAQVHARFERPLLRENEVTEHGITTPSLKLGEIPLPGAGPLKVWITDPKMSASVFSDSRGTTFRGEVHATVAELAGLKLEAGAYAQAVVPTSPLPD